MDKLTDEVRQESPWNIMFANDIGICSESKEQVERSLERWRYALERRGMKVSRSKTEYVCVNERSDGEYGGSGAKRRVQAGWNGWRRVPGVICDRNLSACVKRKVYKT